MNAVYRLALKPVSEVFGAAAAMRGWLYDSGIFSSTKVDVPVVAIGNITVGGTGKTAVVMEILRWAQGKGLKAGVISRGYGRSTRGVQRVDLERAEAAQLFGDEPTMIAEKFPSVPVFVASRRSQAAAALLSQVKVDFIIADDAFQHRALRRDLDLVLIDVTEDLGNYELLPAGRAREPMSALKRARFVVLTKANLASSEKKIALINLLKQNAGDEIELLECDYRISKCVPLRGGNSFAIEKADRVFLASALGRPEAYRATVEPLAEVVGHLVFSDHHIYRSQDVERIIREFNATKADYILVTEKDAVKLQEFAELENVVRVTVLEPQFNGKIQSVYDEIVRLAR